MNKILKLKLKILNQIYNRYLKEIDEKLEYIEDKNRNPKDYQPIHPDNK